jgi:hypothetical protein
MRISLFLLSLLYIGLLLSSYIPKNLYNDSIIEKASAGPDGNIHIIYNDKSSQLIKKDSNLKIDKKWGGDCRELQISPDKKTVGWIFGTSVCLEGNGEVSPVKNFNDCRGQLIKQDRLFIFYAGQQIEVVNGTIVGPWQFWDNGKQLAYHSAFMHGPETYTLYDIIQHESVSDYTSDGEEDLPAWARGIAVYH